MKKTFTFIFAFIFSLILLGQNINVGQLLYYPLNGNTLDNSGNSNNGIANNLTYGNDRLGNPNSAAYFDGNLSFISLPNNPDLKPQLPLSISFWVKIDDINNMNEFFTNDYKENTFSGVFINLNPSSKKIQVSIGNAQPNSSGPQNRRSLNGYTNINSNVWYHVTAVVSSLNDIKLFLNCQFDGGSYDGTATSLVYSNEPGAIGVNDIFGYNPFYFKGYMDEIRYWNRALSNLEVSELCSNTANIVNFESPNLNLILTPNPAYETITIDQEFASENPEYVIFNSLGQNIKKGKIDSQKSINVDELSRGIYFINIIDDSKIFSGKFIKN